MYASRTPTHAAGQSEDKHILCINGLERLGLGRHNDHQLLYFCPFRSFPAQDQPEKAKYVPQSNPLRCPLLASCLQLPQANSLQSDTEPPLLSQQSFVTPRLPLHIGRKQGSLARANYCWSKLWINSLCLFSFALHLFPQKQAHFIKQSLIRN